MSTKVKGSCLCSSVSYEITGNIGLFQYCHCSRCRKFTGSAHAANLFVKPDQFLWLKGENLLGNYAPEESKHFTTAFCKQCGSSLPWSPKTGGVVIIPAGTLDEHPGIEPIQSIFYASKAEWYISPSELPFHDALPKKS